ncbi:carboxymuconolactone decarboxylase family protein [Microbacterium sp. NPDC091313]
MTTRTPAAAGGVPPAPHPRASDAGPVWSALREIRPGYARAAVEFDRSTRGEALDAKTRAFVRMALNGAVTHLREDALREAMSDARNAGASAEEILEVLLVTCTIGVHGMNADVLAEVLAERGEPVDTEALSPAQERIREDYRRTRGYWRDFLDPTLALAPDFLEAYLGFSGAPWREGALDPKTREFLYLAFDTSPTHLHMAGLRVHIHNALDHGANIDEIVAVMAMSAGLGLQTLEAANAAWQAVYLTDNS